MDDNGRVSEMGRRLVVMRHAKAEGSASSDRARRLTDRGVRDAVAAGRWLAESQLVPERALVSSAARARATFDGVADGLGGTPELQVVDELYGADVVEVVELCRQLPEPVATALVVGHNPTMAELVQALQRDPEHEWSAHLPTAGIAVLSLDGDWAGLELGAASLDGWHVPRG